MCPLILIGFVQVQGDTEAVELSADQYRAYSLLIKSSSGVFEGAKLISTKPLLAGSVDALIVEVLDKLSIVGDDRFELRLAGAVLTQAALLIMPTKAQLELSVVAP